MRRSGSRYLSHTSPREWRISRRGALGGLAVFAAAVLAIHLFSAGHLQGWQRWVVELPLHLLVLLAAHHIFFGPGSRR